MSALVVEREADPWVTPLLLALLGCLCEQARKDGAPVCWCCLSHTAAAVPMDDCSCDCESPDGQKAMGQGFVRLVSLDVRDAISGSRGSYGAANPCDLVVWRATIELGIYRCVSVIDEDGNPPSCLERTADTLGLLADLATLRRTVHCCPLLNDDNSGIEWRPYQALPAGPAGGCAGWRLQILADLPSGGIRVTA